MRYFTIVFVLLGVSLSAQTRLTNQDYIDRYYAIAVRKMIEYKIPASITLAQGILESGSGNSNLAKNANNHFGIKCHSDWTGEGYYMDDDAKDECFRVYASPEQSYDDHSEFLTTRSRYKFLFTDNKVDDYKAWAKGLKQAGYATNPNYPNLLITIIERHELSQYDKMGLKDIGEAPLVAEQVITEEDNTQDWDENLPENSYYTDAKKDVFIYNRAKAIKSKDRQILAVANEYDIDVKKLMKYNDIHEGYSFSPDQFVYLQPKRKKGTEKTHIVKEGETMWEISQKYGVKMSKLYSKNNMVFDKQAKAGEVIYLKSKREDKPKVMSYKEVLNDKNRLIEEEEAKKQAIIDAEKKAAEAAAKKEYETAVAAQLKAAELEAKAELAKREKQALEQAMAVEKLKETQVFDAEQHPPVKMVDEKADSTEVYIEKEYGEVKVLTYSVKVGDTLYSLSNKFYVTVEELKEMNNLTNNNLSVGQVLVVSRP